MAQDDLPPIEVSSVGEGITRFWVAGYVSVFLVRCGESAVLIDSGFEETGRQLSSMLEELDVHRIEYLINTHADRDHTGGNAALGKGATIVSHAACARTLAEQEGFPPAGLPTRTLTDPLRLPCGGEEIELIPLPGGHTNGDLLVYLPSRGLVHLGDIIVPETFPVVWHHYGDEVGVERLMEVLATILRRFPEDTRFLSGHGREVSMEDLRAHHDMVVRTVERVREGIRRGLTVEEMKEEDILAEWTSWNHPDHEWINTGFWIETVVESLGRR